jgi:hypothetical protein
MVTVPAETAVTLPVASTVAMAELELDQAAVEVTSVLFPLTATAVAESITDCAVPPTLLDNTTAVAESETWSMAFSETKKPSQAVNVESATTDRITTTIAADFRNSTI